MPIHIKYGNLEIEASTPKEAAELIRLMGVAPGDAPRVALSPRPSTESAAARSPQQQGTTARTCLALLKMLKKEGEIPTEQVAARLHLKSAAGLGPITPHMNRRLAEIGLTADDVYKRSRDGEGRSRTWKPGPRIDDAIRHLEADQ